MKFEVISGTPSLNEMVKKKIDAKQNTASTKAKRKFDVVFNEDHLAKAKEENDIFYILKKFGSETFDSMQFITLEYGDDSACYLNLTFGKCPHCFKERSFSVETLTQSFYCSRCEKSGNVVMLLSLLKNISIKEAVELLNYKK